VVDCYYYYYVVVVVVVVVVVLAVAAVVDKFCNVSESDISRVHKP
jgi:hypothetical protein